MISVQEKENPSNNNTFTHLISLKHTLDSGLWIEKGFCCSGESTRLLFHEMCENVVVLSVHARLPLAVILYQ